MNGALAGDIVVVPESLTGIECGANKDFIVRESVVGDAGSETWTVLLILVSQIFQKHVLYLKWYDAQSSSGTFLLLQPSSERHRIGRLVSDE